MVIMNKKELSKCPNGTVFMLYRPQILDDEIHILTGQDDYYKPKNKVFWNGELSLTPSMDYEDVMGYPNIMTQWMTTDNSSTDYDDDQLFAVFCKTEVQQMINALIWALNGCNSYFDEDSWFIAEKKYSDEDYYEMVEEERKNKN